MLASPTTVKGSVVDAETGQPIPRFSLVHGTVWNAGERPIWQRNMRADEEAKKTPGSFEWTFSEQVHQLIIRVEAEGYLPAVSGLLRSKARSANSRSVSPRPGRSEAPS